ncbi:Uncharacterised protein [Streptococcus macacae NCTC 11558]|uniref:Uncharacterized protein n=1 Tax=Streptococcus macacae NCTC 11558 TaxID=764298 RepID=G5JVW7_9STRE|nr:hypothetical protein STRMA_1135 [Streptococcus macacae NCTC 11558]SUN78958.1 Uncharacterised protein [Streptococcus macacae NCTC 11558]
MKAKILLQLLSILKSGEDYLTLFDKGLAFFACKTPLKANYLL